MLLIRILNKIFKCLRKDIHIFNNNNNKNTIFKDKLSFIYSL